MKWQFWKKDRITKKEEFEIILQGYISVLVKYGNKLKEIYKDEELEKRENEIAKAIGETENLLEMLDFIISSPPLREYLETVINRTKRYNDILNQLVNV